MFLSMVFVLAGALKASCHLAAIASGAVYGEPMLPVTRFLDIFS